MPQHEPMFPHASRELAEERRRLAPKEAVAFRAFSQSVFAEGALPAKAKQLIAVAMEAIWVAAEMRAGAAYAHSALALDTIARRPRQPPST